MTAQGEVSQSKKVEDVSALPERGKKALALLLQQPGKAGQLDAGDLPEDGYPAYLLPEGEDYMLIANNTRYPNVQENRTGDGILIEDNCLIPISLLHDGLMMISSGSAPIEISGTATYYSRTKIMRSEKSIHSDNDTQSQVQDGITMTVSLSEDMRHVSLITFRGRDRVEYARIERWEAVS